MQYNALAQVHNSMRDCRKTSAVWLGALRGLQTCVELCKVRSILLTAGNNVATLAYDA